MRVEAMIREIESLGWTVKCFNNEQYKSLKSFMVAIVQEGHDWDVAGSFWAKSKSGAMKAAHAWAKDMATKGATQ